MKDGGQVPVYQSKTNGWCHSLSALKLIQSWIAFSLQPNHFWDADWNHLAQMLPDGLIWDTAKCDCCEFTCWKNHTKGVMYQGSIQPD